VQNLVEFSQILVKISGHLHSEEPKNLWKIPFFWVGKWQNFSKINHWLGCLWFQRG
jgi:hypothetical protein